MLCINAKFSISHQFFPMKIPQDAHIDNVFFCKNPVDNCNCPQIFLRFDVNRDKSDVMMPFGMIDWSDVFRVFRQACSSFSQACCVHRESPALVTSEVFHAYDLRLSSCFKKNKDSSIREMNDLSRNVVTSSARPIRRKVRTGACVALKT
jgi:hypothetical protein